MLHRTLTVVDGLVAGLHRSCRQPGLPGEHHAGKGEMPSHQACDLSVGDAEGNMRRSGTGGAHGQLKRWPEQPWSTGRACILIRARLPAARSLAADGHPLGRPLIWLSHHPWAKPGMTHRNERNVRRRIQSPISMLLCLVKTSLAGIFGGFGAAAGGGHDRDGPLLAEGTLLSGHEIQQLRERARGGRRIVRRPARLRQPIRGPGRRGGSGVSRAGRGRPRGRRTASGSG